jgi:hypothetical protein
MVKGIVKVKEQSGYATCSWDMTLRIWKSHVMPASMIEHHAGVFKVHDPFAARCTETSISDFERSHPRFVLPSLVRFLRLPRSPPVTLCCCLLITGAVCYDVGRRCSESYECGMNAMLKNLISACKLSVPNRCTLGRTLHSM